MHETTVKGSRMVPQIGILDTDATKAMSPYVKGFLASITSIRWYTDEISSYDSYLNVFRCIPAAADVASFSSTATELAAADRMHIFEEGRGREGRRGVLNPNDDVATGSDRSRNDGRRSESALAVLFVGIWLKTTAHSAMLQTHVLSGLIR